MISTRGRYALRVMIDIANHSTGSYVPMKEVALRQNISLKYIEQIAPVLTKAGFIEGVHGKGGGYRLARKPSDYTVGEILRVTEKDLAPVACLECGGAGCDMAKRCPTLPMWKEYYAITQDFFDGKTLADLIRAQAEKAN